MALSMQELDKTKKPQFWDSPNCWEALESCPGGNIKVQVETGPQSSGSSYTGRPLHKTTNTFYPATGLKRQAQLLKGMLRCSHTMYKSFAFY